MRNRIFKKLMYFLEKRGIQIILSEQKIYFLTRISVQTATIRKGNAVICMQQLDIKISFWQSLRYLAIVGEVASSDVKIQSTIFSAVPFKIENLNFAFRIGARTKLISVDINNNLSFILQLVKRKDEYELIFNTEKISWNNFILLFKDHFITDFLKNSYSKDTFSILSYLIVGRKTNSIPLFNAILKYDDWSLSEINKENIVIDEAYLRTLAKSRVNTYIPFEEIPRLLIDTVLTTEDPEFWSHQGISKYFVGYAIKENIEKRKVVRGASTITMQLVKNLFLPFDRTFMRKIEEVTITLLLEKYYEIRKEAMIEMYLNIIEFAPNVHGIHAASRHYFEKECAELSFTEMLVLTYIIPRPLFFEEALLMQTEQLKNNLYNHIKFFSEIMYSRKQITLNALENINYVIEFSSSFGSLDLFVVKVNRSKLDQRSLKNLEGVHPDLTRVVQETIALSPIPFTVTTGVRTIEGQQKLYAQGRTTSGNIVTNADGVHHKSNHNPRDDGYGYAVDLYPCINGRIDFEGVGELKIIAQCLLSMSDALDVNIQWGGDWESIKDYGHFELE